MKIKSDLLQVAHIPGVEPEAQPVRRVQIGAAPVSVQGTGQSLGELRTEIVKDATAAEVASGMRHFCSNCRFFDHKRWLALKKVWENGTLEQRKFVNGYRALLLETQNAKVQEMHAGADGMDVEHALQYLGICQAISEVQQQPVVVHPMSHCPDAFKTPASPNGLFQFADKNAEKRSSAAFDDVMLRAEGKKG